jgi:hypothetical protein
MANKFTFKKIKHTGKFAWLNEEEHDIKIGKFKVGSISEKSKHFKDIPADQKYSIMLATVNPEQKSGFSWITIKAKFSNAQEARDFLDKNFEAIITKYELYKFQD